MRRLNKLIRHRNRQTGALTLFTAVMVLLVLTLMIFYAARVGLFEQRVSANEVRQKAAFHAAEAALEQGMEYLLANSRLILSTSAGGFPDGSGGTRDGWRAANKWTVCTAGNIADITHPCGGQLPMKPNSAFYNDATTGYAMTDIISPPAAAGVTSRLTANICSIDLDAPETCLGLGGATAGGTFMVITLMGYGFSDCTDINDTTTCLGEAAVARPVGNWKALQGVPTVPLVTRSVFPPNGTALVVPNPNGGGVGVPISAWVNDNSGGDCPGDADAVLSSGTWNTCELQEWYGRNDVPAGVACDKPPGQCSCTEEESISFKKTGQVTVLGIDIVKDKAFPCDLFQTYFGSVDTSYDTSVKPLATILSDCSTLDETTEAGFYWISGAECRFNNVTIGSPDNPVIIVSATDQTSISGSFTLFGLLYVFDGEKPAEFTGAGTASIYGSLIVDAAMDKFTGTVNVVYASGVLQKAADLGGFGTINGGWRDFGLPEVAW